MGRFWCYFLLILLCIPSVFAAVVEGSIYDISLEPISDAIIEVNSTPIQRIVSKDGSFTFSIPPGVYVLSASYTQGFVDYFAQQNITIIDDGAFRTDMVLTPLISDDGLLDDDLDLDSVAQEVETLPDTGNSWPLFVSLGIVVLLIVGIGAYELLRVRKVGGPNLDVDQVQQVVDFISAQGGRCTQKEVRKAFPLSEAKISLILSELENDGKVKKIKQGKGNIIVLVK